VVHQEKDVGIQTLPDCLAALLIGPHCLIWEASMEMEMDRPLWQAHPLGPSEISLAMGIESP
jgi:hypothetical protein